METHKIYCYFYGKLLPHKVVGTKLLQNDPIRFPIDILCPYLFFHLPVNEVTPILSYFWAER